MKARVSLGLPVPHTGDANPVQTGQHDGERQQNPGSEERIAHGGWPEPNVGGVVDRDRNRVEHDDADDESQDGGTESVGSHVKRLRARSVLRV